VTIFAFFRQNRADDPLPNTAGNRWEHWAVTQVAVTIFCKAFVESLGVNDHGYLQPLNTMEDSGYGNWW